MIFLRWLLSAFAMFAAAWIVPGIRVANAWSALLAALVIGLLNVLVRPMLIFLTLPVNILTLGLFTFVINGILFYLAGTIVKGFDVVNFHAAFFGALVYWIAMWIASGLFDLNP